MRLYFLIDFIDILIFCKEIGLMESIANGERETRGVKRRFSESPVTQKKKRTAAITATKRILTNVTTDNIKGNISCKYCCQVQTEDVSIPPDAKDECIVLANDVLANIYTDNSEIIHNLTGYSIYDNNGHMCSIDSGIMERNSLLYLAGYVKPIYDNGPGIEDGFAAMKLGPISEWWLSSNDGGSRLIVGITTSYADYLLIEPHPDYKKYMTSVTEKIYLSRLVLDSMILSEYDDPTYEDILNCVVTTINPATDHKFTEDDLIGHAQFVLDQVLDYDSYDTHHLPLAETQFIETLTELSGAARTVKAPSKRLQRSGHRTRGVKHDISKRDFSKATTTELVKDVFENMFAAQLDVDDKENEVTMDKLVKTVFDDVCNKQMKKQSKLNVIDVDIKQDLCEKMFVLVKSNNSSVPLIGRIKYLSNETKNKTTAHIQLFILGYETVLGEAADPQEIFALKKCMFIDIKNVIKVLDVTQKEPSTEWYNLGDSKLKDLLEPVDRNNKNSFFYQLQYDDEFGRFEYPKPESDNFCVNCKLNLLEKKSRIPKTFDFIEKDGKINYFYYFNLHNEKYKNGSFIYLKPGFFKSARRSNLIGIKPFIHTISNRSKCNQLLKDVDETIYPEYYRKTQENTMRGSNETTPDPFEIAEILAIYIVDGESKENVKLVVRRMYRAEQIPLGDYNNADMNLLYWSEEEFRISYKDIFGKCYVSYIGNIPNPLLWSAGGPDRFYFEYKYDFETGSFIQDKLSNEAKLTGKEVSFTSKHVKEDKLQYIPSYEKINPLRGLDLFAGCGGLSRGLEDSGLIKSKWAVECDDKAANAFELNNPESTVFVEDCNHLLKLAMSGNKTNSKNQKIPQRGEVDFICGGPPCQGFSGMNRFNSGQYSLFKNSLIVSFLSYIDYYRPKYFIMENVRNFVSFKRSMVLKLTLRCITRMGYQCTFGILQAGNFGVPQTRRRLIIMAAAPGEILPLYPEPKHVFNRKGSSLIVQVGDKRFRTNCKYDEYAPMRTVTVYDAWSDLPEISNGDFLEEIAYKSKPMTHLQKLLRCPDNEFYESILTDHICKDMSPLVQARMELIPVGEGSDWRDLPNVEVKLSDGTMTNKLRYAHHDVKNGKGPDNVFRGVCQCATGEKCNPQDRQNNTIIPWCLPHTGNRHNNWAGLYGRLAWKGFCSTTITNPEPMGKQGRVLHPEQNRVVSVRECARSQGFKDTYIFHGPIVNKHRQIGNAVPPPMGTAIGHEIIKVICQKS